LTDEPFCGPTHAFLAFFAFFAGAAAPSARSAVDEARPEEEPAEARAKASEAEGRRSHATAAPTARRTSELALRPVLRAFGIFLKSEQVTPILGKLPYARLLAMRRMYAHAFGVDLRADLKRHSCSSPKYGKLVRHFTMTRAEWAYKRFRDAQAAEKKAVAATARAAAEHFVEALCVLEHDGMRELRELFERDKRTSGYTLLEEIDSRWLLSHPSGELVRKLLVGVVKNRLGAGGASLGDAQLQGEALAEFLERDDPVGLEALCRQLCANRSRHYLALVREGYTKKAGAWLNARGESTVLRRLRSATDDLLHQALTMLLNDPAVPWTHQLYTNLSQAAVDSAPQGAAMQQGGSGPASLKSLMSTWQLDGGAVTDALTHLVTVCKDDQLARVSELLDLDPYNMSLGTLILSISDAETRRLLGMIVDTALTVQRRPAR